MENDKTMNVVITSIIIGLIIAALAFANMFISVRFVLANGVNANNIISYTIISLVLGTIGGIFFYFRYYGAFVIFLACVVIGFIQMYRTYFEGLDGWGDLAGFLTLLTWIMLGFLIGIGTQIIMFVIRRIRKIE